MRSAMQTMFIVGLVIFASCDRSRVDDHTRYEPVIAKIRSLGLKAGERRQFRLADPGKAATLSLTPQSSESPRGQGAGTVWVEKDEQGHLLIAVETVDRGHAGEWGYLYAEPGVALSRGQSIERPGREWTLERDLGNGWWAVSYRLG